MTRRSNECGHPERAHQARGMCKACHARDLRERQGEAGRRHRRDYHLRTSYGVSADDVDRRFERQGRACALCLRAIKSVIEAHVDHCHETGRVRGLLCGGCNKGLGLLGDTRLGLQRALAYVSGSPMFMLKPDARMVGRAVASGASGVPQNHLHEFLEGVDQ